MTGKSGCLFALLASLVETGAIDQAAKLLEMYPLPLSAGRSRCCFADLSTLFRFARDGSREAGQKDEAKKNQELYLKYGAGQATLNSGLCDPRVVRHLLDRGAARDRTVKIGGGAEAFVVEAGQAEAFL